MAEYNIEVKGLEGTKDIREMLGFVLRIENAHKKALAEETQKIIRRTIQSRITRPNSTGKLADWAGRIETTQELGISFIGLRARTTYGVGNIDDLNREVPYWRWINFGVAGTGRKVPPASRGKFSPGPAKPTPEAFGAGRWLQGEDSFTIFPKKPITPMNYIETTISIINARAGAIISRVKPISV